MADWPNIPEPKPLPGTHQKRQIKADFKAGYVHSHAAETRSRKSWVLTWEVLDLGDYDTLETFFDANIGGTFTWDNPVDSATYTVRFSEGEIKFDYGGDDPTTGVYLKGVSLGLEEN